MPLSEADKRHMYRHLVQDARFHAVVGLDARGRVLLWNAGAELTFGYAEAEIRGRDASLIFTDEDCAAGVPADEMQRARTEGVANDVRWHQRKDGSRFWGHGVLVYVGRPHHGEAPPAPGGLHFVKILTDRTGRRRADELLEQEVQAARRFAATAAHDLRAPLRTVRVGLQLVLRVEAALAERSRSILEQGVASLSALSELVDRLTWWSRPTSPDDRPPEPVDVGAVMDHVVGSLADDVARAGATITRSPLPTVLADVVQVRQLLQNLLTNALDHGGEAPRVHVRAVRQGERWGFEVTDTGPGIPEAEQERIFEPLERSGRGAGMGLAISRRIVEEHGGTLGVRSAPGHGATFTFDLPADPTPGGVDVE